MKVHWKVPLKVHWKRHRRSTMISEVSISGVQSFAPRVTSSQPASGQLAGSWLADKLPAAAGAAQRRLSCVICVHMYTYVCVYIYIYNYDYNYHYNYITICMHIYIYIYIYICIYVYNSIYNYIYVYMYMYPSDRKHRKQGLPGSRSHHPFRPTPPWGDST